jgi:type II secretory pathway component PulF
MAMTNATLAATYKNFAELYDAGIDIVTLLETIRTTERDPITKAQLGQVAKLIQKGSTLAEALNRARFVPSFDVPAVQAGEKAGTLMKVFEALSKKYEVRAQAERTIKAGLMKPISLLGIGLFVLPFADLFNGKISINEYLMTSGGIFGTFLIIVFLAFRFNREAAFDLQLAEMKHNLFVWIPGVSKVVQLAALENFATTLSSLLEAGMPMFESLELSYRTSADKKIRDAVKRILLALKSGKPLPESFQREERFGPQIHAAVTLGTQSGKLPILLQRQATELNRQVIESIERLSKWIPGLVYAVIAIYVAKQVIGFYTGQFKGMDKMLELDKLGM